MRSVAVPDRFSLLPQRPFEERQPSLPEPSPVRILAAMSSVDPMGDVGARGVSSVSFGKEVEVTSGCVWFEEPGPENTERVLDVVQQRLAADEIAHVVIATTTGETGVRFCQALASRAVERICVTHHIGFRGGDADDLVPSHRERILTSGGRILTATHALSGIGRSFSKAFGGVTPTEIVAHTLRLFGQGMKVCVEVAIMAADAGLVPTDRRIICVGGTGRGADTAVSLTPAHMSNFFDLRIHETLCRPTGRAGVK